jgi:predicted metal-dependent phosphoesterase TrpH
MIKMDLHVHSMYSEDAIGTPKEIIKILKKNGIQGVAFTDHNSVSGGLKALKISPENFLVIPGIEISTADGHMLALDVKEKIKRGLSIEETVERIIDIGGTPVAPHLFRMMSGIKKENLKKIYKQLPAIEIFNGCSVPKSNLKAAKVAKEFNLGGIGGSDAHDPRYVGYAYTLLNIRTLDIDSVISEINKKKTWGKGNTMPLHYRRGRMQKSIKQFFQRGAKRI